MQLRGKEIMLAHARQEQELLLRAIVVMICCLLQIMTNLSTF